MSVLALDLGGTRVKAGIVENGRVLAEEVLDVEGDASLRGLLPRIKPLHDSLAATAGLAAAAEAMICALPCIVSPDSRGVSRTFGKYDDSVAMDLNAWSVAALGMPTVLENDARAAAIGEWRHGAGKGCENLVMVTLGTGIGTAVIEAGKALRGAHGVAGNLGAHSILHVGGRTCVCGMRGCLEAHVATWALPGLAEESPLFVESSLSSASPIDYRAVFEHAGHGDMLAVQLRDNAIEHWSVLLINLIHQYDPECIVLGGGIMAGKENILPPLRAKLQEALAPLHRNTRVLATELGDRAALIGCEEVWQSAIPGRG